MSDIFSNAFNGISNAIHDVGKSSIGQLAEAAALTYFLGPAGAEFSLPTAAGLAGGITNLVNGGNIGSALTAGAMAYGLGSLAEPSETAIDTENGPAGRGPAPSASDTLKTTGVNVNQNVAQYASPTALNSSATGYPGLNPMFSTNDLNAGITNSPFNSIGAAQIPADVTPPQMALSNSMEYANAVNPIERPTPTFTPASAPTAPASSGNIFSKAYDYLTTSGTAADAAKTAAGQTTLYQDFKNLSPLAKAGLGLGAISLLKSASKPSTVTAPVNKGKIAYFGGNLYSGPTNMYQTSAATGGLVALAKGGAVKGFSGADGSYVAGNGHLLVPDGGQDENGNPTYTDMGVQQAAPAAPVTPAAAVTPAAPIVSDNTAANPAIVANPVNTVAAAPVVTANPVPTATGLLALGSNPATNAGLQVADAQYVNNLLNPTAANVAAFQNTANQSVKNQAIMDAVNAAQGASGGNNASANTIISRLMDQWQVTPGAVSNAAPGNLSPSDITKLYDVVDPTGIYNQTNNAFTSGLPASQTAAGQKSAADALNAAAIAAAAQSAGVPGATSVPAILSGIAANTGGAGIPYTGGKTGGTTDGTTTLPGTIVTSGTNVTPVDWDAIIAAKLAKAKAANDAASLAYAQSQAASVNAANGVPTNVNPVISLGTTTTSNGKVLNTATLKDGTQITLNPTDTTTSNVSTPTNISSAPASSLASGVGGNNAVVMPNGTISQSLPIPGIPASGFTGMQQLMNAYTTGGGSTGYVNPPAPAVNTEAATQHYLDMLSGKIPFSKTPYTPTGEIAKPYYSSVMGMPINPKYTISQPYIFDSTTKSYVRNPQYDPNFSATADYLGAYSPGYTGPAVTPLSQSSIDLINGAGGNVPASGSGSTATAPIGPNTPGLSTSTVTLPGGVVGNPVTDYPGYIKGNDGKYYDKNGNLVAKNDAEFQSLVNSTTNGANGGLMSLAVGGMAGMSIGHLGGYSDGGRLLRGPGDGVSDSIPATIGTTNPEPARLADGEFVVPARIVSELGNGSTEAGARQLYKMMDRIQNARSKTVGKDRVATNTNANQYLPA